MICPRRDKVVVVSDDEERLKTLSERRTDIEPS